MIWDERTLSRLHSQHNARLSTAQVEAIAAWVESRDCDNPTALLVACLKRADPDEPPPRTAPRQHRPDRSYRRDLAPMSDAERAASAVAMRECIDRVRAMLEAPREIVTHDPHGPVRG